MNEPLWMRNTLLGAAIYNLLWGAWVVLFPGAMWGWLSMPAPNYPELWQCIGMIVGVYGVGYGIAAFDPARHWPIVLVGLLGKVLGPIGMGLALWRGTLPWEFAVTCLANDLVWWVPFGLILRHAWQRFRDEQGDQLLAEAELLSSTVTSTGATLTELSTQGPVLLVLLRHSGCIFCKEALADLARARSGLEQKGVKLVFGHMSPPASFANFAAFYGLDDLPAISDPARRLYRGLGLRRGTLSQLLGWRVWRRGARAFFSGHTAGLPQGDPLQMPGAFLLRDGLVIGRQIHRAASERPDYEALCKMEAVPQASR